MTTIKDVLNPPYLEFYKRNQELFKQIMCPSPVLQYAISMSQGIQNLWSAHQHISTALNSPVALTNDMRKAWNKSLEYQSAIVQLNKQLQTSSAVDFIDLSNINSTNFTIDPISIFSDDSLSKDELEIINSLESDSKFINWFRLTFPELSKSPIKVIVRYFFYEILAPFIVHCLITLYEQNKR